MRGRDLRAHPLQVLIVEDDALFAEALATFLDRDDRLHVLAVAKDLRAAVAEARGGPVDIALVDVRLEPPDNGFGVIEALRELDPTIVTMMMSGLDPADYADDAARAGAQSIVQKSEFTADGRDRLVRAFFSAQG